MAMKTNRSIGRRGFLASGAAAMGAGFWAQEDLEAATQNVQSNSRPSELKITDMRIAMVSKGNRGIPVIRLDTNQGISGYGEVRDGGSKTYALILKSRLLGENPCNVDKIFRKIKQFGFHARQAGGVCGVEMALWDLAGKAYNVPAYQMLGGKFRDKIRIYADTTMSPDPKVYAERMKGRIEMGLTYLKMDLGIRLVEKTPGTL
ncbi:MAG: mandelate racemase/muconate lactonizing enzyme family protein, partial [bacterium]|nr:mandelate racemase/muconate lactonizing enzyme family protein [bacterium]